MKYIVFMTCNDGTQIQDIFKAVSMEVAYDTATVQAPEDAFIYDIRPYEAWLEFNVENLKAEIVRMGEDHDAELEKRGAVLNEMARDMGELVIEKKKLEEIVKLNRKQDLGDAYRYAKMAYELHGDVDFDALESLRKAAEGEQTQAS